MGGDGRNVKQNGGSGARHKPCSGRGCGRNLLPPSLSGRRPRGPKRRGGTAASAATRGHVRSLALRGARRAVPATPLQSRRGAPRVSSAETKVTSTASCGGSHLAMTTICRSSRRSTSTLGSCMSTLQVTVALASQHTRAVARSRGMVRGRSNQERGHAARWFQKRSTACIQGCENSFRCLVIDCFSVTCNGRAVTAGVVFQRNRDWHPYSPQYMGCHFTGLAQRWRAKSASAESG